ncbi:DUF1330 domain-containing protein [Iodidimonas sp. SYSU 1G8]|uniref:DUF1330 domain-containing protein n=1 Tax=Iodidimonas sp. SYSU 1G8 TaxID=3133967 RepID=UPI0031FE6E60
MTRVAYMFIGIDIRDEAGMAQYVEEAPPILASYGGRILAVDNDAELLDGVYRRERMVLLGFPSLEQARSFWKSPEYQPMKVLRERSSEQDCLLLEAFSDDPLPETGTGAVFMIGGGDTRDMEAMKPYYAEVPAISARFGVQAIAAGINFDQLDGGWPHKSFVCLRFPSEDVFRKFWYGDEYLPYKTLREQNADGMHMMVRGI